MNESMISTTNAGGGQENLSTAINLQRMRLIDQAWNARDWPLYASFLSPDFVGHAPGVAGSCNKLQHVEHAKSFCDAHPDARVITDSYIVLFGNEDWTCSIARLDRVLEQSQRSTLGDGAPESRSDSDLMFVAVCRWESETIVEQYEFEGEIALERLVGGKYSRSVA